LVVVCRLQVAMVRKQDEVEGLLRELQAKVASLAGLVPLHVFSNSTVARADVGVADTADEVVLEWGGEGAPFRSDSESHDRRPRKRSSRRVLRQSPASRDIKTPVAGSKRTREPLTKGECAASDVTHAPGLQALRLRRTIGDWRDDNSADDSRMKTTPRGQVAPRIAGMPGGRRQQPPNPTGTPDGYWENVTLDARWSETRTEREVRRMEQQLEWQQHRFVDGRS